MRDLLAIIGALLLMGLAVGMISKLFWWALLGGGLYFGYRAITKSDNKQIK